MTIPERVQIQVSQDLVDAAGRLERRISRLAPITGARPFSPLRRWDRRGQGHFHDLDQLPQDRQHVVP